MTLRKLTRGTAPRRGRTPRPWQRAATAEGRWRGRQRGLRPRTGGPGNARTLTPRGPSTWHPTGNTIRRFLRRAPDWAHDRGGRPGARAPVDHTPRRVVAPPRRRERLGRDEGAARESATTCASRWRGRQSRPASTGLVGVLPALIRPSGRQPAIHAAELRCESGDLVR